MDDSQNRNDDTRPRNDEETDPLLPRETATTPYKRLSVGIILALTCINGGLQVFFSTVMANLSVHSFTFFCYLASLTNISAIPAKAGPLEIRRGSHHHRASAIRSINRPYSRSPERSSSNALWKTETYHPRWSPTYDCVSASSGLDWANCAPHCRLSRYKTLRRL